MFHSGNPFFGFGVYSLLQVRAVWIVLQLGPWIELTYCWRSSVALFQRGNLFFEGLLAVKKISVHCKGRVNLESSLSRFWFLLFKQYYLDGPVPVFLSQVYPDCLRSQLKPSKLSALR